jgi:3D (Asp-Asp-Asp) domain-containing protein
MKLLIWIIWLSSAVPMWARTPSGPARFLATAHSVKGITAKGTLAHEGVVAADPAVLPLGSRIRVSRAGAYSGVYVVTDTGAKVEGRHIDIYLRNNAEAKRFGRKTVTVRVLTRGDNRKDGREVTPKTASRPH